MLYETFYRQNALLRHPTTAQKHPSAYLTHIKSIMLLILTHTTGKHPWTGLWGWHRWDRILEGKICRFLDWSHTFSDTASACHESHCTCNYSHRSVNQQTSSIPNRNTACLTACYSSSWTRWTKLTSLTCLLFKQILAQQQQQQLHLYTYDDKSLASISSISSLHVLLSTSSASLQVKTSSWQMFPCQHIKTTQERPIITPFSAVLSKKQLDCWL